MENTRLTPEKENEIIQLLESERVAFFNENFRKSINLCNQVLDFDPYNGTVWHNKGESYYYLDMHKKAEESFDNAIHYGSNIFETWALRGLNFGCLNKFREAIQCFNKAIKFDENDPELFYNKGLAYFELKEYDKSIRCFDQTLELESEHAGAWHSKGLIAFGRKDYDASIKYFNKALSIDKKIGDSWLYMGKIHASQNKEDEALVCFNEAIKINNKDFDAWYGKAILLSGQKDHINSLKSLNKAIKINDKNSEAWALKGIIHSFSKEDNTNKDSHQSIKCFDKSLSLEETPQVFGYRAICYWSLKQYTKALTDIHKALELDTKHLSNWYYKACILSSELRNKKDTDKNTYKEIGFCFAKAGKSILDILTLLGKGTWDETMVIIYSMLDNEVFFQQIIESEKNAQNIEAYKELYVKSLRIVASLHVNHIEEDGVAHYTRKTILEQLLFDNSPFRLNTITTANDPKEGKPLLSYLGLDAASISDDYQAFIASFIFNPDSLNQFRLYGKDNNQEATGVSLSMSKEYFNEEVNINQNLIDNINEKKKSPKEALFRCIYIDPLTNQIISVGHKEEYIFFREKQEQIDLCNDLHKKNLLLKKISENISQYKKHISNCILEVKENLEDLQLQIKNNPQLNLEIVSELLIHLRYLVKHVAFKEEQECRIIKVERLINNKDVVKLENNSRMYIDYLPIADNLKSVYFAPKTNGFELFKDIVKREGLSVECYKCEHPFS